MIDSNITYYNSHTDWAHEVSQHFLIRGFTYKETMPALVIQNGDKINYPWPYLIMFFHSSATIILDDKLEQVKENTLMIWSPGQIHRYGDTNKEWTHSWLIVDFPDMSQFSKSYPLPVNQPFNTAAGDIFAQFLRMFYHEFKRDTDDIFYQQNLLQLFLYSLHRQCKHNFTAIPQRVQEMEVYMSLHLQDNLSVDDIAKFFGLSKPHFSALFHEYYHLPPMQYLNSLRLKKAAQLLQFYPYSCKEVARLAGFRDPLYFSRCFKLFWGLSPSEYRDRHNKN